MNIGRLLHVCFSGAVKTASAAALALLFGATLAIAQSDPAVVRDPAPDKAHPAHMEQLEIPSHGATLFGTFYAASGAGPHPTVLLLHGFPGYEQNLDLAQAIRRAGWNVFTFHYRGAWGSHGDFSFQHAIEDTANMIAWLRQPANAKRLSVDPAHIVVIGHSMGGFMAAYAGSHDPGVAAVGMISAWNIGGEAATLTPATDQAALAEFRSNSGPLAGCTPESLLAEAKQHARQWNFLDYASALAKHPLLLIDADDGSRPDSLALAAAVKHAGDTAVKEEHFSTDHPYSDQRLALESAVVQWLRGLQ